MTLLQLELSRFRCYEHAAFTFSADVNVIQGPNGVGKTCLLEAVAFLSAARSPRTPRERELIRFGESRADIAASFRSGGRESSLEITLSASARRKMSADGLALKSPRELLGRLPSVYFAPEDLELLRGGAAGRRRFMDAALCQFRPRYLSLLSSYRRLVDGKTAILRRGAERPDLLDALPEYNRAIAATGAELSAFRLAFCAELSERAARHHRSISGEKETLQLEYKTHAADPEETLAHIEARRAAELARGACLVGAHKDDISAKLDGRDIRDYGSQGQVRTGVIAMKLAERDLFSRAFGEPPLLLLDDVLSELDEGRRDYILHGLSGGQALITCCSPDGLRASEIGKNIILSPPGPGPCA